MEEENNGKQVFTVWIQPKKDYQASGKLRQITTTINSQVIDTKLEVSNRLAFHSGTNGTVKQQCNKEDNVNQPGPTASLLKYEIRHLTNLKQIGTGNNLKSNKSREKFQISSEKECNGNMSEQVRTPRFRQTDDALAERVRTSRHNRRISDENNSIERIRPTRVGRSIESRKIDCDENMNERQNQQTEDSLTDRVRTSRNNRRISDESNGVDRVRRTRTRTADDGDGSAERPRTYRSSRSRTDIINKECEKCIEKQERIIKLEKDIANEKDNNAKELNELQTQLSGTLKDRDDFAKEIKKLQKEINKINKKLDDESVQNRRFTIKLEDANYEIGRLRQELINSQLENEKIVEENEDLAVDNEDLIKERDEIIQIYDELFHESERLKRELNIWKTVVENNLDNLPSLRLEDDGEAKETADNSKKGVDDDKEEEDAFELEEDQSLLVPPRNDIRIKTTEFSGAFEQNDEIARGKFGKVYKIIARATGDTYAAKYIKVTPKLREDVLNTIDIMKKIHHARLMNIFDVYDQGTQIVMILEYVGGGMLFERIVEKKYLTEADCALHIKQILQGLHHLHLQHIAHLDLRPENIVCVNRNSMDIKIIDFGLAKQLDAKKVIKITAGSPEFVAPEILSFDPVSLNSDLWSVGVITYVLLSGMSPFIGEDDNDTLLNVSCGEYEYEEHTFQNITRDARSFIDNLLVSCPKKRPNVSRCLQHPWITTNWQAKQNEIDLENMKKFLEKRKEKGNVSAVRAIRRFSSFGVGLLNPRGGTGGAPLQRTQSKHLIVPNALQSSIIEEGDEGSEDENQNIKNINSCLLKGPTITVTKDEHTSHKSRPCSGEVSPDIPENTDTPDGLRDYLQRMISSGMLPGRSGPQEIAEHSDDER